MPWRRHHPAARRPPRGLARAGRRRTARDPSPRRPRRAGDQDRAAGRGDFARGYDTTVHGLRATSSGSTAARNRSRSISSEPTARRPRPAARARGRLRAEPRARRRRSARASAPTPARALPRLSSARSPATARGPVSRRAKPTTCWCRARAGLSRSPAPRTPGESASRSPTSPPACMPSGILNRAPRARPQRRGHDRRHLAVRRARGVDERALPADAPTPAARPSASA